MVTYKSLNCVQDFEVLFISQFFSCAQEKNRMSPARAQTWTAHSGVEHTNHEAIAHHVFFV